MRLDGSSPAVRWLGASLPWILLLLFAGRSLLAMRADGATADEMRHLAYGERALRAGTFLRDDERLNSKMPVSMLNATPPALAVLAEGGLPLSDARRLFLARLPTLLLGSLLGFLVWSWSRDLFGDSGGALALLLYTFCPNVLAHSHLVTTDIPTALGMFAAVYCFWLYLERPGRGRLLLAATTLGFAQLTKVTAVFLFPIFILVLGIRRGRGALREWWLLPTLGLGALAVLNLGFLGEGTFTALKEYPAHGYTFVSPGFQSLAATPGLRDLPLPLPFAYVQGLDMVSRDSRGGTWTYLRGRYSQTGFRSYFIWSFLVKVPLATQFLLLTSLWLWASGRSRASGAEAFLLVPVVFLALYLSLFFELDIGLRYLLPAFPFLFVFAGRSSAILRPVSGAPWQPALGGGLLLWLAVASWRVHPHYIPYFNELAGGPDNGWRWLIDSNLDWDQDRERVRNLYARQSPVPVLIDPSGPVAGRIAVGLSNLVGRDPESSRRHAWLRDNFQPVATIGYSWRIFDVTEADLTRCCAALPAVRAVDRLADDLALRGVPFAGGDGVEVRFVERINDGTLGDNGAADPARTVPPRPHPVRAWFGVEWGAPQEVGRVAAFPSFGSRGPMSRRFLALDYVFQFWDGEGWRDFPGTRVTGNGSVVLEHRFPPVRTRRIRLLIERQRNDRGAEADSGGFRAACLELAAYRQ